jgi:ribosomal protein S18 acetylase RimI-like enzyme
LGAAVIRFITEQEGGGGVEIMKIRVNKNNQGAITFYEKVGFVRKDEITTDIGNGYVMDDFVYEKKINVIAH